VQRGLFTLYDAALGLTLLFTPWTRYWQDNWLIWQSGSLQSYLLSGPVRGAVSGFGAAFLIHAAGRLVGVPLLDEDDPPAAPPGVPVPPAPQAKSIREACDPGVDAEAAARPTDPARDAGAAPSPEPSDTDRRNADDPSADREHRGRDRESELGPAAALPAAPAGARER